MKKVTNYEQSLGSPKRLRSRCVYEGFLERVEVARPVLVVGVTTSWLGLWMSSSQGWSCGCHHLTLGVVDEMAKQG